jgi:hypothetical protein
MSLRAYGIIMHDNGHRPLPNVPAGAQVLPLRELAAVTENGDYTARDVEPADIERHLDVVSTVFKQDTILPMPVGTVFRSQDVLQRWMELHYVALSDALAWVEDRVGARVHVSRVNARGGHNGGGSAGGDSRSDLAAIAGEITKELRRHAVANVALRTENISGTMLSGAFLVEKPLWNEFTEAVQREAAPHPAVRVSITGPWPPYDFVRMQFGA